MSTLKVYTIDTAPEESKSLLEHSKKMYGAIPNLHGVLAESPELLAAYKELHELFVNSSFNSEEQTVVWQTINVESGCHYCVPAHTMIANMMKVDPKLTEALRNKAAMPTERLQVLQDTTLILYRTRGYITESEESTFFNAGYTQRQLFEIILGLAQKTISNYTNHIFNTPLDPYIGQYAWK